MDSEINEVDRLSSLPDSVLVRILSFLPARDAARTVLIRPFGHLWTAMDRLDFSDTHFGNHDEYGTNYYFALMVNEKFIRFVRYFLMLHNSSTIHRFTVQYSQVFDTWDEDNLPEVNKLVTEMQMWVRFALNRGVQVLDWCSRIKGSCPQEYNFTLPYLTWTTQSLVKLSLCDCELGEPKQVNLGFLKILELDGVHLSSEMLSKIEHGCPLLQDLSLTDCFGLENLSLMASNIKTLRVGVDYDEYHCWDNVRVNCPNVISFSFSGLVGCVEIINLASVKLVTFDLSMYIHEDEVNYKRFLTSIQHAGVLELNNDAVEVLTYGVLHNHPCPRNKWKRVVLHTWMNEKYILGICSLLRYSSYLEELIIYIEHSSSILFLPEDIRLELHDLGHVLPDNWSSEFMIQNLKTVTMHGLFEDSCSAQIELVKVILKNAPNLDKVYIYIKGNPRLAEKDVLPTHRLFEISTKLLTFPRASNQAMVFLL